MHLVQKKENITQKQCGTAVDFQETHTQLCHSNSQCVGFKQFGYFDSAAGPMCMSARLGRPIFQLLILAFVALSFAQGSPTFLNPNWSKRNFIIFAYNKTVFF